MTVENIDHAHVLVTGRAASVAWYGHVLRLRPDLRFEVWAAQPGGPLVLCTQGSQVALSLFVRPSVEQVQDGTVAFRMGGAAFVAFLARLPDLRLPDHAGAILSRTNLIDHRLSHSIYALDPERIRIEVTT